MHENPRPFSLFQKLPFIDVRDQDASVAELTDDESATNQSQEKAIEEERRLQEQKQREIEMARLAELQEIAEEEREAELARQAAELAGLF